MSFTIPLSYVFHGKGEKKKRDLLQSALSMNRQISYLLLFHPGSSTVSSNAVDPPLADTDCPPHLSAARYRWDSSRETSLFYYEWYITVNITSLKSVKKRGSNDTPP